MYDLEWKRSREHLICFRVQVKVSLKSLVPSKIQSLSTIFSLRVWATPCGDQFWYDRNDGIFSRGKIQNYPSSYKPRLSL